MGPGPKTPSNSRRVAASTLSRLKSATSITPDMLAAAAKRSGRDSATLKAP